jgi:hypothetical protein
VHFNPFKGLVNVPGFVACAAGALQYKPAFPGTKIGVDYMGFGSRELQQ